MAYSGDKPIKAIKEKKEVKGEPVKGIIKLNVIAPTEEIEIEEKPLIIAESVPIQPKPIDVIKPPSPKDDGKLIKLKKEIASKDFDKYKYMLKKNQSQLLIAYSENTTHKTISGGKLYPPKYSESETKIQKQNLNKKYE